MALWYDDCAECAHCFDGTLCNIIVTQAVVGDGQVTQGSQVMKPNARKVRRIGGNGVIIGSAWRMPFATIALSFRKLVLAQVCRRNG